MSEAPASELQIAVPGYRVERLLGRGGFGVVLAAAAADGTRVALKIANAGDAVAAAQLAREEKALRAVGPAAAPAVLGSGIVPGGPPYLALELLEPPTLAQRLREAGPLRDAELRRVSLALCDVVAAVHAAGYVHLDLKPENVFLTSRGVRLIDFGLARPPGEPRERGPTFAGTAEYASPEQCEEKARVDARADVYALGVILFEMIAGRPPFTGEPQAVREAQIGLRPPRPSQFAPVPSTVEQIVLKALVKDRARRTASAAELKAALQAALDEAAPAETASSAKAAGAGPRLERRNVGLLLFASTADAGSVQGAIRSLGGELGWAGRGRYAAVFPGEAGQDPVRRAFRAAQGLSERKLAVRAVIDVAAVNAQRRADGQVRYLAPELGRDERYASDTEPLGALATSAAAELLPDVEWEAVPGRPGMLAARPGAADRLQAATVVQLGAGPLVGREDVIRELLAAAKDASLGMPAVATVVAEPGHGKTHLAATVVEKLRVHVPDAEVLDLRAREPVPGDADETLRALLSRTLETPAGAGEQLACARFTSVVGPELAGALWPAVALTLRLISPDATQVRALAAAPGVLRSMAMRAAGEALRARARRRPICVVLDDAQFADDTALDALEYAALAEAKAPVFVCALGRPSFAEARKSFGERSARQVVHHLGPLEAARAAELCRRLLAPAENVPQAAIDLLVRRTQGIPLLLVELVRGLKRDGLVRKRMRGDTWFLATDELERVPDSPLVEWLAQRELVSVSEDLASHARLAALLGLEFGADEMAGVVAELDAQQAGGDFPLDAHVATRRLAGVGLLMTTRTGGFRFRHALVRDAVARSVAAPLRQRVHEAAACFYSTTRAIPDVRRLPLLARHSAEAGLRREAARLYLELAHEARNRHQYLDAERSYTCSLDALETAESAHRLAALHGRGTTRYRLGRYEDALADLTEARNLAEQAGDPYLQADILLDASTALDWTTDYVGSSELVDRAEPLAGGESPPAVRAKLVLCKGRALWRVGRRPEACAALERAVALAEQSGDQAYETLIIALIMLVSALPELGRIEDAERMSARAIALANDRGDRLHLGVALNNRRNMRIARKDVSGACEDLTACMQIGREMGVVTAEHMAEFNLCEVLYQAGQIDAAIQHGRRAAQIEARHPEVASQGPLAMLLLARIDAYRGREAEARETLRAIDSVLERERREKRESGALSAPNEKVLLELVDLCTRDATKLEWEALLHRSASDSVEQEPIEVADLYGTWALRRGKLEEAREAFEEAARRAARIPNIMDGRVQRGLAATGGPAT